MNHKPYMAVYDGDTFIDGTEFDSFEEAKAAVIDTFLLWETDECRNWKFDGMPCPTQKQIESWDYMILNCTSYVVEWDEEKQEYGDYDTAYYFSDDELNEIGWMVWSELKEVL